MCVCVCVCVCVCAPLECLSQKWPLLKHGGGQLIQHVLEQDKINQYITRGLSFLPSGARLGP